MESTANQSVTATPRPLGEYLAERSTLNRFALGLLAGSVRGAGIGAAAGAITGAVIYLFQGAMFGAVFGAFGGAFGGLILATIIVMVAKPNMSTPDLLRSTTRYGLAPGAIGLVLVGVALATGSEIQGQVLWAAMSVSAMVCGAWAGPRLALDIATRFRGPAPVSDFDPPVKFLQVAIVSVVLGILFQIGFAIF